jgi:hypothetical protein
MVPVGFGIQSETQKKFAFIYPNPSNGNLRLLLPESGTASYRYMIYDITGKMIRTGTLSVTGDQAVYPLDLTFLPKGIYIIRLDSGKSVYENKVILR